MSKSVSLLIVACLALLGTGPLSARPWKKQPDQVAFDYAAITDNRPEGEYVLAVWLAPPATLPNAPAQAKEFLKKYTVILAAWGRLDRSLAKSSFQDISAVEVRKISGQALKPITRESLPAANAAVLASLEAYFRQLYGPIGPGIKTFIFDPGGVDACGKGGLTARLANETYSWDLPFPGCTAN